MDIEAIEVRGEWEVYEDVHKRRYYYNALKQITQWEKPDVFRKIQEVGKQHTKREGN